MSDQCGTCTHLDTQAFKPDGSYVCYVPIKPKKTFPPVPIAERKCPFGTRRKDQDACSAYNVKLLRNRR